jgi:RNA polymerase sigma-70 factor (ECF subfamily)
MHQPVGADQADAVLALYDEALPQVHGYLLSRCRDVQVAEDLTGETFLAAVGAVRRDAVPDLTVAWLITVARNKLVDHWRRLEREERRLRLVHAADDDVVPDAAEGWDALVDAGEAHRVLAGLGSHHRSALTLRYLDGLSVPDVADVLGRTVHATEALLVRARGAFRRAYEEGAGR